MQVSNVNLAKASVGFGSSVVNPNKNHGSIPVLSFGAAQDTLELTKQEDKKSPLGKIALIGAGLAAAVFAAYKLIKGKGSIKDVAAATEKVVNEAAPAAEKAAEKTTAAVKNGISKNPKKRIIAELKRGELNANSVAFRLEQRSIDKLKETTIHERRTLAGVQEKLKAFQAKKIR